MSKEFTFTIELGNAEMRTAEHVAQALKETAEHIEEGNTEGTLCDVNGNTVGRYALALPVEDHYEEGHRYTTEELEELPVISQGQADDCHVDSGSVRVWLSRTGVADGEPFDNTVTVERLQDGAWVEVAKYDGDSDEDASEDVQSAV